MAITEARGFEVGVQFGIESTAGTGVTPTIKLLATRESFKDQHDAVVVPGFTGQRGRSKVRRRLTMQPNGGGLSVPVQTDQIDEILKIIFPTYSTGVATLGSGASPFATGAALVSHTFEIDKVSRVLTFAGCKCNTARFYSSQNDPTLMCDMDFVGMGVTRGNAGSATGSISGPTGNVFLHTDMTLTISDGTTTVTVKPTSVELTINHGLIADRFRNSRTRLSVPEGRRTVSFSVECDWSTSGTATEDIQKLYNALFGGTGCTITLVYSTGSVTATFVSATQGAFITGEVPDTDVNTDLIPSRWAFDLLTSVDPANDEVKCTIS